MVLGRTPFRESDWILSLFTDQSGKISALARGARKSQKRFGGALEPMHTLRVELVPGRGDLSTLKSAELERPRALLLSRLDGLNAAGRALSWVRRAAPNHTPEPALWHALESCLDELTTEGAAPPDAVLGAFGLRLLETLGWGLHLSGCVVCGKLCPRGRPAWVNPERGGLVCRACGGGPFQLSAEDREHLAAVALGTERRLATTVTHVAQKLVERALGAHLGFEEGNGPQRIG